MATKTMNLADYRKALGLSVSQMAWAIQSLTGVTIPNDLLFEAERELFNGRDTPRAPMAEPKAKAIAAFISKEMGRVVTVQDLGLETI